MAGWRFTRTDYIPTTHRIAVRQFLAQRPKDRRAYCGLAVVVVIAGLLRIWRLNSLHAGLRYDEAYDDVVARRIYRGEIAPVFVPENNGHEPLHMYLIAPTGEEGRSLDRLTHPFPTGHVVWEVDNWGAPFAVDFRIPGGTTASAPTRRVPVRATVGNRVGLLGYDLGTD